MKTGQELSDVAQASDPMTLLQKATGCVYGRDHGTPFCDLIIEEQEHRITFHSPAEFESFRKAVEHVGIPAHSHENLLRFATVAAIAAGTLLTMLYLIDAR